MAWTRLVTTIAGALEPDAQVSTLQGLVNLDGTDVEDVSEDANVVRMRTPVAAGGSWEGAFVLVLGDEGAARSALDAGRAGLHLGWRPFTSLKEGTAATLEWFRSTQG